jgi:peptidoglycan L-alanyl-D-glutamate endopeptidase CwlK
VALLDPYGELPRIQWQARDRLKTLASRFQSATGLHLTVRRLGGLRTCAQQDALYAQGREAGGEIVTHASGCTSWHVLGRAADVDVIDRNGVMQPASTYAVAGQLWEALGGKWGGNFPGFPDIGHFEYHPGLTIEQACPSPTYCAAIQASIQTSAPFSYYMLIGGAVAVLGSGVWLAWQHRDAWLSERFRPHAH